MPEKNKGPMRMRPHRLARECYRGHVVVAITACIEDRKPLFADASAVRACVERLRLAANHFECTVPIYCFMPEHLHLLLRGTSVAADAWAAMASFKQQSGFWIAANRPELSWQKDFWDHIVRRAEDVQALIRYIANNPVRRGLAKEWDEYPFTGSIGHVLQDLLEGVYGLDW